MAVYVTTTPLQVAPAAAAPISHTATILWANSAWVEVVPATSGAWALAGIVIGGSASDIQREYDVGIGAAGVETVFTTFRFASYNSGSTLNSYLLPLPVTGIGSGVRVSIRTRANGSSASTVALLYYPDGDSDQNTAVPTRCVPSAASGTSVTPNATAWANSAWTEITPSLVTGTGAPALAAFTFSGGDNDLDYEVELGVGAAAAEVVLATWSGGIGTVTAGDITVFNVPAPILVPSGSRLAWRLRKSGTNVNAWNGGSVIYYDGVVDVEPLQKVTQQVLLVGYDELADEDPPLVVEPCDGGGTVPTGTNPAAGTSLATATEPLAWLRLTLTSGTIVEYAAVGIPHGTQKVARVESFGTLRRRLTDKDGGPQASSITTTLIDTDRVVRTLAASGALTYALAEYFAADLATLKAGGTPARLFRGRVQRWTAEANLRISLTVEDELSARLTSAEAADLQVPITVVNPITDNNPTERMFDKPAPEIYGHVSDDTNEEPVGVWECPYVGSISFDPGPGGEVDNLHTFLVCVGAIGSGQTIFGGNPLEDPPVTRVALPESAYGDWIWWTAMPATWFGATRYHTDGGVGRRWSVLVGLEGHPVVEMARTGRIRFVVNACGYETVGDGTRATIDSVPRGFQHWLNARLVQDSTNSNWPTTIFALGDHSVLDTTTFAAVHTICDALNMPLAGVLGHDYAFISWRDRVAEWCRNGGFRFGPNRHGQFGIWKLDRAASYSSRRTFTQGDEILDRGCQVNQRQDAVENVVQYAYARNYLSKLQQLNPQPEERGLREPYDGPWLSGVLTLEDAASITALGGTPRGRRTSALQEYSLIRDAATALLLATDRRDWYSPANGRPIIDFDLSLRDGWGLELGDVIGLEHWDTSWTGEHRCWVQELALSLDTWIMTVVVEDVEDLLP